MSGRYAYRAAWLLRHQVYPARQTSFPRLGNRRRITSLCFGASRSRWRGRALRRRWSWSPHSPGRSIRLRLPRCPRWQPRWRCEARLPGAFRAAWAPEHGATVSQFCWCGHRVIALGSQKYIVQQASRCRSAVHGPPPPFSNTLPERRQQMIGCLQICCIQALREFLEYRLQDRAGMFALSPGCP